MRTVYGPTITPTTPESREIGTTQATTNHQLRCKSGCFFLRTREGKKDSSTKKMMRCDVSVTNAVPVPATSRIDRVIPDGLFQFLLASRVLVNHLRQQQRPYLCILE